MLLTNFAHVECIDLRLSPALAAVINDKIAAELGESCIRKLVLPEGCPFSEKALLDFCYQEPAMRNHLCILDVVASEGITANFADHFLRVCGTQVREVPNLTIQGYYEVLSEAPVRPTMLILRNPPAQNLTDQTEHLITLANGSYMLSVESRRVTWNAQTKCLRLSVACP